jgi:hypothetical protein
MASDPLDSEARLLALYKDRNQENKKLGDLLNDAKKEGSPMDSDRGSKIRREVETQRKQVKAILDQIDKLEIEKGT